MSGFPPEMTVEIFLSKPDQLEQLGQWKVACANYLQKGDESFKYFESSNQLERSDTTEYLRSDEKIGHGLHEIMLHCEVVVKFHPEE
jgi:hypothetical protein